MLHPTLACGEIEKVDCLPKLVETFNENRIGLRCSLSRLEGLCTNLDLSGQQEERIDGEQTFGIHFCWQRGQLEIVYVAMSFLCSRRIVSHFH